MENMTKDELVAEITRLENLAKAFNDKQMSIKLVLNSIYGCLGSKFFSFFDKDIAETVTLQGQDLILFIENKLVEYMNLEWHLDFELHKAIGIETPSKITERCGVYIDTDSVYLNFEPMLKSIKGFDGDKLDMILKVYEHRLKDYIVKHLDAYAETFNCDNLQDFELETISKSAVFIGKKKYFLNLSWKDGNRLLENSKISIKGFEIRRSDYPSFSREKLKFLVKKFLVEGHIDIKPLSAIMKDMKKEFALANINAISENKKVNNYERYVICDTTELKFAEKAPFHLKAAGHYNFILNNNPKLKAKYSFINNGDKIKLYQFTNPKKKGELDYFAFKPNMHPYEIAPPLNVDAQFSKTLLDPVNRILAACNLPTLTKNILFVNSIF